MILFVLEEKKKS